MKLSFIKIQLFLLLMPGSLFAWGLVGHETIAYIAKARLSPQAKERVAAILGPGQDMASVSGWADLIVMTRPETAPWHYFNLDVRQTQTPYEIADACPLHGCVVDQIKKDLGILAGPLNPLKQKREALKFLIHFVGDLHQPLHCSDDHDRGGNEKWFRYYGPRGTWRRYQWVDFHAFWDSLLETRVYEGSRRLSRRLEEEISPAEAEAWEKGNVTDWAYEGFKLAQDEIYKGLPSGPVPKDDRWGKDLPQDYYSGKMRGIVDKQLEKAGVRLAFLLNEVFQ